MHEFAVTDRLADSSAKPSEHAGAEDPVARAHAAFRAARFGETESRCLDVLRGDPNNLEALRLRGLVAIRQARFEQAISLFEQTLAIEPNDPTSLANVSELYRQTYRLDDALAAARRLCGVQPNAPHLVRLGQILVDCGDLDDALIHLVGALSFEPADPNAHLAIGQILLARGEFRSGWFEYEWRVRLPQARSAMPRMKAPQWNGMVLPKGRILLIADQGFGDIIFFARYIMAVAERCNEVVLACSQMLRPLLERIPGVWKFIQNWQDSPKFTAYSRLSSLPNVFGTELHTIPAKVPYLTPHPDKIAYWRQRLNENCSADLKVGVFWAGRPTHPNDRRRSLRLEQLAPLFDIAGIQFVSLQKDVPPQDAEVIRKRKSLVHLCDEFADFEDTAAVIGNLDHIVTVDSAVAHLAGALGAPVGMMTPRPSDWRWLLDRDDSPWYPTMRLYRQRAPGEWDDVVARIAADLVARTMKTNQPRP